MPIKPPSPSTTPRLTPQEFDAVLASKGWTKKEAALRWGITAVWVSNISRDANRPPHWDDAVLGLPNKRFLARNEKRRRKLVEALAAQASGQRKATGGFRYHGYLSVGAIVAAAEDVGSIAEAGMRGIVFRVRDTGKNEEYGVIFETGEHDWFPPEYVDQLLVSTGLVDEETAKANLATDEAVETRFGTGQFQFW